MTTPFDVYASMLNKSAADALVPGQVGAGPNPGTTGSMDSDMAEASNTQLALQRFAQGEAPVLSNPSADAGAGYSTPPAGVSPSLQMFADVKAASIVNEGRAFANYVYEQVKTAAQAEKAAASTFQAPKPLVDAGNWAANQATRVGQAMATHANNPAVAAGAGVAGGVALGAGGMALAQRTTQGVNGQAAAGTKAASLDEAVEAGRQFALQCLMNQA